MTELLPINDVTIPNEKVGCILVARHLQQFLEGYLPPSDKQAFLDVHHMLSLLDKYLYDNPKEHTHCMSLDNEYVALLKYVSWPENQSILFFVYFSNISNEPDIFHGCTS